MLGVLVLVLPMIRAHAAVLQMSGAANGLGNNWLHSGDDHRALSARNWCYRMTLFVRM